MLLINDFLVIAEYEYKSALRVPGSDVLNVYLCDTNNWGWANFPPGVFDYPTYDGVVVANSLIYGLFRPIDTCMTVVHETGEFYFLISRSKILSSSSCMMLPTFQDIG